MADKMCCDSTEVHEDLLKIVNDTMPEETEFMTWQNCSRYLEILPESEYYSCYLKQKYVYAIWRRY